MGPSEACRFHEKEILKNTSPLKLLANGSINPIKISVYHLHNVWRNSNFGSVNYPFEKLYYIIHKVDISIFILIIAVLYKYMILDFRFNIHSFTLGISVFVNEDTPWVILVTTQIMKRAQLLSTSRKIIFCDNSSSCDTLETTRSLFY